MGNVSWVGSVLYRSLRTSHHDRLRRVRRLSKLSVHRDMFDVWSVSIYVVWRYCFCTSDTIKVEGARDHQRYGAAAAYSRSAPAYTRPNGLQRPFFPPAICSNRAHPPSTVPSLPPPCGVLAASLRVGVCVCVCVIVHLCSSRCLCM